MKQPPRVEIRSIKDGLHWLDDVRRIHNPMFKAINAVQDDAPVMQIVSLMAAAKCLCDAVGYDPVHLIRQLEQAQGDIDSPFTHQWKAITNYAHQEFKVAGKFNPPPEILIP
jgi:hypothetical protein